MTGLNINQPDLPWWAVAVMNWLMMVKSIGSSSKGAWLDMLDVHLERYPPEKIYDLYKTYVEAVKAEMRK